MTINKKQQQCFSDDHESNNKGKNQFNKCNPTKILWIIALVYFHLNYT